MDLSATAKGFAVDEVARLLDARYISSYLVEIGGELRARGSKPDGSSWKVAIERPSPMGADALATATMVSRPEEGYRLAEREALAVQLIIRSGDGFRVLATPQFESYLRR